MGKPFKFTLEKVLEYRQQLEDQARLALAEARRRHQRQAALLEDLEVELARHEQAGADRQECSAEELWLWLKYKERLLQDIEEAEKELQRLARELNARREEAVTRAKDRKLLEKLKENQARNHAEQNRLVEQKTFDDMATIRHGRKAF